MKAFLYTGAALMIGAGIYGFADYKQTSRKNEFKTMYSEETTPVTAEKKEAVVTTAVNTTAVTATVTPAKEVKKTTVVKNKAKKKKRTFSTRLFSRGALDERYIAPPPPPAEVKTEKTTTDH